MTPRAVAIAGGPARAGRRWADFVALTKPRVLLMVLVTTAVGYYVGSVGGPDPRGFLNTLFSTALAAAGVLALNQFLERDLDALMARTRSRPLPDGRIQPGEALLFGLALTLTGLAYQALALNRASVLVTAITAASYLLAYTPLKRRSSLCAVVGAIPGALPPVTGWAAARGEFGFGAGILFVILFLWQLPHTLAIASVYRSDYACAGMRVLPVVDAEGGSTGRQAAVSCGALLAVGLLPTLVGMTGTLYLLGTLGLGIGLFACALGLAVSDSPAAARRLMVATLVYLPALFALMAVDKLPF